MRREGRLTPAQSRAIARFGERFGIAGALNAENLDRAFGRRAPRILEIGCGRGEVLVELARRHPENDYIGIEVFRPGIGQLLARLAELELANVRTVCRDALDVCEQWTEPPSLDAVYVFFPDPWPKKRHHKRRLLTADLLTRLRDALNEHGRLFIATDWADYAETIMQSAASIGGLVSLGVHGGAAPRPRWRPLTRFEARALTEGRPVFDLCFARSTY